MPKPESHAPLERFAAEGTRFLRVGGQVVRDLNGNGKLDLYEDPRAPTEARVEDLLTRMTVAEKVGLMFHAAVAVPKSGKVNSPIRMSSSHLSTMVSGRHMRHFNIVLTPRAKTVACWHNRVQRLSEQTRLGIPVTIASDPRHAVGANPGAGMYQQGFSQWPSQLGLAATGDESLIEAFGDIGRQEFMSVGIRTILNPMADVATEPRWGRVGGTFGEDFERASRFCAAYVRGFQQGPGGLHKGSVSCMVKHFPGGGAQEDGTEPHFKDGARQVYPDNRFRDHLAPFQASFAAGAQQLMLSYGIPMDQTSENVAFAFNFDIVQKLLRDELGFNGLVCTDWITHEPEPVAGCIPLKDPSCWGVEHLSVEARYLKSINAGVDQFGGQSQPSRLLELFKSGHITEERIDESARRALRIKFELGLFENPYVDPDLVTQRAGTHTFAKAGLEAQRRSMILLTNKKQQNAPGALLPLRGKPKLYVEHIDKATAERYGEVVKSPLDADVAILNMVSPRRFKLSTKLLSYFFAEGDLDFPPRTLKRLLRTCRQVPTIINIRLDRPPVIPELAAQAGALFVSFGVQDSVLLDAVFGKYSLSGRLPVELPASMHAVRASATDSPGSGSALFPHAHGLDCGEQVLPQRRIKTP